MKFVTLQIAAALLAAGGVYADAEPERSFLRGYDVDDFESLLWSSKSPDTCTRNCKCQIGGCTLPACTQNCKCQAGGCAMPACTNNCKCQGGDCAMQACVSNCKCQGGGCAMPSCQRACKCMGGGCDGIGEDEGVELHIN